MRMLVYVERQEQAPALTATSRSGIKGFMLSVIVRKRDGERRLPDSTGWPILHDHLLSYNALAGNVRPSDLDDNERVRAVLVRKHQTSPVRVFCIPCEVNVRTPVGCRGAAIPCRLPYFIRKTIQPQSSTGSIKSNVFIKERWPSRNGEHMSRAVPSVKCAMQQKRKRDHQTDHSCGEEDKRYGDWLAHLSMANV